MADNLVRYPELTAENVVEILYRILNAESQEVENHPCFIQASSHPAVIDEVEYSPCAVLREEFGVKGPFPISPRHELAKLYTQNPEGEEFFWTGITQVLDDICTDAGSFKQPYAQGEFLTALYRFGRTSPQEFSDALKKMVDEGTLKGKNIQYWDGPAAMKKGSAQYSVIMALAAHQWGIGPAYWREKLETESDFCFIACFTGLCYADLHQAEEFLQQHQGKMPVANDRVKIQLRSIKKKIGKEHGG